MSARTVLGPGKSTHNNSYKVSVYLNLHAEKRQKVVLIANSDKKPTTQYLIEAKLLQ